MDTIPNEILSLILDFYINGINSRNRHMIASTVCKRWYILCKRRTKLPRTLYGLPYIVWKKILKYLYYNSEIAYDHSLRKLIGAHVTKNPLIAVTTIRHMHPLLDKTGFYCFAKKWLDS